MTSGILLIVHWILVIDKYIILIIRIFDFNLLQKMSTLKQKQFPSFIRNMMLPVIFISHFSYAFAQENNHFSLITYSWSQDSISITNDRLNDYKNKVDLYKVAFPTYKYDGVQHISSWDLHVLSSNMGLLVADARTFPKMKIFSSWTEAIDFDPDPRRKEFCGQFRLSYAFKAWGKDFQDLRDPRSDSLLSDRFGNIVYIGNDVDISSWDIENAIILSTSMLYVLDENWAIASSWAIPSWYDVSNVSNIVKRWDYILMTKTKYDENDNDVILFDVFWLKWNKLLLLDTYNVWWKPLLNEFYGPKHHFIQQTNEDGQMLLNVYEKNNPKNKSQVLYSPKSAYGLDVSKKYIYIFNKWKDDIDGIDTLEYNRFSINDNAWKALFVTRKWLIATDKWYLLRIEETWKTTKVWSFEWAIEMRSDGSEESILEDQKWTLVFRGEDICYKIPDLRFLSKLDSGLYLFKDPKKTMDAISWGVAGVLDSKKNAYTYHLLNWFFDTLHEFKLPSCDIWTWLWISKSSDNSCVQFRDYKIDEHGRKFLFFDLIGSYKYFMVCINDQNTSPAILVGNKNLWDISFPSLWVAKSIVDENYVLHYIDTSGRIYVIWKMAINSKDKTPLLFIKNGLAKYILENGHFMLTDAQSNIVLSSIDIKDLSEPNMPPKLQNELDSLWITKKHFPWKLTTLESIVDNRHKLMEWDTGSLKKKPIVLLFGPEDDWNGAFSSEPNDEIYDHFTVLYFQRAKSEDLTPIFQCIDSYWLIPEYTIFGWHGTWRSLVPKKWVNCDNLRDAIGKYSHLLNNQVIIDACSSWSNLVPCLSGVMTQANNISWPLKIASTRIVVWVVEWKPMLFYYTWDVPCNDVPWSGKNN